LATISYDVDALDTREKIDIELMADVSKVQMELELIDENDIKDYDHNGVYECFGKGRTNGSIKKGGKSMMFVTWCGE
jgi:hypothetical protein